MEVLEGKAQRLKVATEITGNSEGTFTRHVATLQMGKVPVRLVMPQSIMVTEGDQITVGGLPGSDGVLIGYAYRNLDTGAHGRATSLIDLIGGFVFTAIGVAAGVAMLIGLLNASKGAADGLLMAAFASVFMCSFGYFGLRSVRNFNRTRRAVGALFSKR